MQETTAGELHDIAFMDPLHSAMNFSPTFDACVESPQFRARDQISGLRHIVQRVLRPALHRRSMQDISSCTLMLRRKGAKTGDGSCGSCTAPSDRRLSVFRGIAVGTQVTPRPPPR